MEAFKVSSPKWYDEISSLFYRLASSNYLPAKWFRAPLPAAQTRKQVNGHMSLEIVSHCWNYSNTLAYQLSAYVLHRPTQLTVTVTVYYAQEDVETAKMLDFFSKKDVENVIWNWKVVPKEYLFRRCIGRNFSSLHTKADWIWFTDCDIIFGENCLDTLAKQLQGRTDTLVYPSQEFTTDMLAESNPILENGFTPQIVDIDFDVLNQHDLSKAKGAFQIVHGDVARAVGYCDDITLYQTPSDRWRKTYEDKTFRWLIGSHGEPVDIPNVYQIRHVVKGRYTKGTLWSKIRSKIRRLKE